MFSIFGYKNGSYKANQKNTNFREKSIKNLMQLIEVEEYHYRSKDGFTGVFSHNRKLNFKIP